MKAILEEEQRLVVEVAERMAGNGLQNAQRLLSGAPWPEYPDHDLMANWQGLAIGEADGGSGGRLVDLALLIRTLSIRLTPCRYIDHVIALQAAFGAGLPIDFKVADEGQWCLAVAEPRTPPFGPFACRLSNNRIDGTKTGVPFGNRAEIAIIALEDNRIALAKPSESILSDSADPLAEYACLTFNGSAAEHVSDNANGGLLRATVLIAAELCGVAQGAVDNGSAYAKERAQFGQPIGSYQGVAHQLAEAQVATETAWSLTLYACWAIDSGNSDAQKAVHAAKAKASEAAVFSSERALQVHGGIGMTWESTPHLYLKRAITRAAVLGGTHWHRQQLGSALLSKISSVS